jgi:Ser/Thr protein kinase RdoA (MazF antagonist)
MEQQRNRDEIEDVLRRMQRSSKQLQTYQVLQANISGAATYGLQLADEELILKVTNMQSERYIQERAQRELSFYLEIAPRVPLHVPHIIVSVHDAQFIALLLATYKSPLPASQWQEWQYLEVAEQLGSLHASFWDGAQFPWLPQQQWNCSSSQMQQAIQQWQALQENKRLQELPQQRYQRVMQLLPQLSRIEDLLCSFPLTLCHGDCHIDNLLQDAQGQLIWADWQEVRMGPGPLDLSFFYQRAWQAGGSVPFDKMVAAYQQRLTVETGKALSVEYMQQVLDAIELRSWLLNWPLYLMYSSPQRLLELLERIDLLANHLAF